MAVKSTIDVVAEFKKFQAANKLVIGQEEAVKLLRQGTAQKIFLASNCDPQVKEDINQYCKVGNIECVELSQSNDEIGVLCRKPFAISVVGVAA